MNNLKITFELGKEIEIREEGKEPVTEFKPDYHVETLTLDVSNYDMSDIRFACIQSIDDIKNKIDMIDHIRESLCVDIDEDRVIDLINDNTRSDREICEVVEEGLTISASLEY